jgi:hypothetical protein
LQKVLNWPHRQTVVLRLDNHKKGEKYSPIVFLPTQNKSL